VKQKLKVGPIVTAVQYIYITEILFIPQVLHLVHRMVVLVHFHFASGGIADYCHQCLCVRLFLSVCLYTLVNVTCGHGLVVL